MKTSKTQQALALLDSGEAATPYAAAKRVGVSPVTIYKAISARDERQARRVCPTCHRPLPRDSGKE